MMRTVFLSLLSVCSVSLAGCGQSFCNGGDCGHDHGPVTQPLHASQYVHPTEGPHHGDLVELGNEEFHAEIVHDEATGTLTVYLLDSCAVNAVGSKSTEVKINLSHDGTAEQFVLVASPQPMDSPGESSRYVSHDAELAEELDHAHGSAQLVLMIQGKQYRGKIEHDHDHDLSHDHHHDLSQKSILVK